MIYLDNNATTPLDPAVLEVMLQAYERGVGNPASPHAYGREGKRLLAQSYKTVADYFDVKESELLFTSGATEALNLLLQGFSKRGHIITSTLEHVAVLEPLQRLEKRGWPITYLAPEHGLGSILPSQVESAIRSDTTLIALIGANNETGVMTDLEAIASLAKERGIFFLVDGVAFLGKAPLHIPSGVSALCFSGHKIHAPVGIGCAIVRDRYPFEPQIVGGPQQRQRRGGTENVALVAAFAKALEQLEKHTDAQESMRRLRERLEEGVLRLYPEAIIHGKKEKRVCNVSNIAFPGIDGEGLLIQLDLAHVAVGYGSACSSGSLSPSRVLLNMGIAHELARSSLRFSSSRFTTAEEIDQALKMLSSLL